MSEPPIITAALMVICLGLGIMVGAAYNFDAKNFIPKKRRILKVFILQAVVGVLSLVGFLHILIKTLERFGGAR